MKLPVYIDGKQEGELWDERQGAATVMHADIRDVGRLVRLTVYGHGERGWYLGIPAPEAGRLRLKKRFTPLEMAGFPRQPAYAADRPLAQPGPAPAAEPPAAPAAEVRPDPAAEVQSAPAVEAQPDPAAEEDGPDPDGPAPPAREPFQGVGRRVLWMGGKPYFF